MRNPLPRTLLAAGILEIVAGVLGFAALAVIILIDVVGRNTLSGIFTGLDETIKWNNLFFFTGLPVLYLSGLALAGGILALKRGNWGVVAAGSVAAVFINPLLGVPALILALFYRRNEPVAA